MIIYNTKDFNCKIFEEFKNNYALLTCGDFKTRNTMTISWGFMGTLFNKNMIVVFVRPTRHTFHLMEENERFTLSFMDEKYKKEMEYLGSHSGRDQDKYKETGLIPVYDTDTKVSYIKDAKYVLKCKKVYSDYLKEDCFINKELLKHYDKELSDYHKFYIAEVTSILKNEENE